LPEQIEMRHFRSGRVGLIAVDGVGCVAFANDPPDRDGSHFEFPLLALLFGNLPGVGTFSLGGSRVGGTHLGSARLVGVRFPTIGLGIRTGLAIDAGLEVA
jgi:hypothetical protein